MKKIIFVSFFLFGLITNFALAEENDGFVAQFFKELDINKDGIIDKRELQRHSKKEFNLMDTDKNNIISKREFFVFICKKSCTEADCKCEEATDFSEINEYFDIIDVNHDGEITYQEKLSSDTEEFHNFDANHDGKIKKEEVEAKLY